MPNSSPGSSDISEGDGDAEENELNQLRRQCRILELGRRSQANEAHSIFTKQRAEIRLLESEHNELTKLLNLAGSSGNEARDQENRNQLERILTKEADVEADLKVEKERLDLLQQLIKKIERRLSEQKKRMGGTFRYQAQFVAMQKRVEVLESNLYETKTKFNKLLKENSSLRSQIDHMKAERSIFLSRHHKLDQELTRNRQEIHRLSDMSVSYHQSSTTEKQRLSALNERARKELNHYISESQELERLIDHYNRLREFVETKSEEHDRSYLTKLNLARLEKEREQQSGKNLEAYLDAFEEISRTAEVATLDLMDQVYENLLDRSFSLFNFVSLQHSQVEKLEAEISTLEAEIALNEEKSHSALTDVEKNLAEAKAQLAKDSQNAAASEVQLETCRKVAQECKQAIKQLFDIAGCDRNFIAKGLEDELEINDRNVMTFLAMIEQKTDELLQVQAYISSKSTRRLGMSPPARLAPLATLNDLLSSIKFSDDIADEEAPQMVRVEKPASVVF